jgi:hypothetical protein
LALADDVMIPQVVEMAVIIVVGHANERHFGKNTLSDWVKRSWSNTLTQLPSVKTLSVYAQFSKG